jgi:acyl-CoA synthetase (AMP-forming)/AMP-acid ligase II
MNLFDILAERAAATPSGVYLVHGGGKSTFEDVYAAALRRSRWLSSRGISLGTTVAVVAGRSVATVETIFALLRLGANIVPLDQHEPAQRVSGLVDAANPAFAISEATLRQSVTGGRREMAWIDINETSSVNDPVGGRPNVPDDATAFTFFTSGSTGRPKGIELSHRAVAAGQRWLHSAIRTTSADRQLFRTTLGVTNLLRELIWPVVGGFSAYLLPDGASADVAAHVAAIDSGAVTIVGTVPILVDALISARRTSGSLASLRTIICTSDRFTAEQLRRFAAELPGAHIYNIYGLTEAPYIAMFDCASSAATGDSVPVGLPAELRPLILDDNLERVRTSEVGRIYVSGAGLLTRYWNDSMLTDSRFVTIGGANYFDTGDFGHVDNAGVIHLAGRSEFMIKIGGQRVDVFDLERAFTSVCGVAEACVVPVDIGGGVKRLAAFVVADGVEPVTERDIRATLARSVPDYMLPSLLRFTDRLPRLHNGKLDRQGLASRLSKAKDSVPLMPDGAPPLEALIGSILNASRLDLASSVVELGGDSISAFLISVRAYEMGLQIDPAVLISRSIADAISSAIPAPIAATAPTPRRSGQIEQLSDYGWSADEIDALRARLAAT